MITTTAGSNPDRPRVQTVAVLPFISMSANQDDECFCDGLAEDLLNALAKIDALKVVPRRSAFSFKGKSTTLTDIGTTLGVSNVVEGSIRRSGDRVRMPCMTGSAETPRPPRLESRSIARCSRSRSRTEWQLLRFGKPINTAL